MERFVRISWTEFLHLRPAILTFLHAGMARKAEEERKAMKAASRRRR